MEITDRSVRVSAVNAEWKENQTYVIGALYERNFTIQTGTRFQVDVSGSNLAESPPAKDGSPEEPALEVHNAADELGARFHRDPGLRISDDFTWYSSGSRGSGSVGGDVISMDAWRALLEELTSSHIVSVRVQGPSPWREPLRSQVDGLPK